MATPYSRVTVWVSNQVLTAANLNGEFNNILANAVMSSMFGFSSNVSQMQQQTNPGGVGSESLAGLSSDELQRVRFMLAYILGTTYWYDQSGRNLGAGNLNVLSADYGAGSIPTAAYGAGSVDTTALGAGAVTQAKRAALGQQISSSSGNFVTTSATYSSVTNLTVSITTTGRPVRIELVADGTASTSGISVPSSGMSFSLNETTGPTTVAVIGLSGSSYALPVSAISHTYVPVAGSYTYVLQLKATTGGNSCVVNFAKLIAYEL